LICDACVSSCDEEMDLNICYYNTDKRILQDFFGAGLTCRQICCIIDEMTDIFYWNNLTVSLRENLMRDCAFVLDQYSENERRRIWN